MTTWPAIEQQPAALGRALDRVRATGSPDADAAEQALTQVLRPIVGSVWPEVAWRFGVLTATGYPVELAWASRDTALRWTSEVAGPETPEADRLWRAVALAARWAGAEVGGPTVAGSGPLPARAAPWVAVQQGHRLRWGAWLGARHLDGTRRVKVYLELPAGEIAPGPWREAGSRLASRVPGLTWRMAGINNDGSVELYARATDLDWASLAAAADLVGDEGRLADVVGELITRVTAGGSGSGARAGPRRAGRVVLPRPSGVSLVLAPSGTPVALTWFAIAKHIWAGDAAVRAAVLRTTAAVACPPGSRELYQALSSGPDDGRWQHGMVGVGIDRRGGTWLQAGLRPT